MKKAATKTSRIKKKTPSRPPPPQAASKTRQDPAAVGGFDLDQFLEQKLGPSLGWGWDRVRFEFDLALAYRVAEEACLETVLYSLQDLEEVQVKHPFLHIKLIPLLLQKLAASPSAAAAHREVLLYRDLLLLGDLATISQEKRPYQWLQQAGSLSGPGTPPPPPASLTPPSQPRRPS